MFKEYEVVREWIIMHELLTIYWANKARLESIGFLNSLQHTDKIAKTRGKKKTEFSRFKSIKLIRKKKHKIKYNSLLNYFYLNKGLIYIIGNRKLYIIVVIHSGMEGIKSIRWVLGCFQVMPLIM